MARPIKNNADYFPHDADMRNDTRIKAVRRKFGIEGYGVYCMLLELLTDSEFFEFKNDALSIELIAGDFDIEPGKLTAILQYFMQLDLIQMDAKTSIISCKSLDNRLEPLLSKRKRDRIGVIADDNTQSKVKESKVDEIKEKKIREKESSPDFELFKKWGEDMVSGNDFIFQQKFQNEFPNWGGGPEKFVEIIEDHFQMLNRYPKMNPNTQERFRNSVIKHFKEYKQKPNGTGNRKGLDVNTELQLIANHLKGGQ